MKNLEELFNEIDSNEAWFNKYIKEIDDSTLIKLINCLPSTKNSSKVIKAYKLFDKSIADKLLNLVILSPYTVINGLEKEINKRNLNTASLQS
ncbi:hypothetical protein [Staphylococcus nepalensis]|uniref:hypothetical protein n=1 Tax=Staphylococcus nepalensis TaxID=214473 RepID=UPI0024B9D84A|nr:hypothetical protein [Staphylococcus nepalensis]